MPQIIKKHLSFLSILILLALPLSVSACGISEKTHAGYENASLEHAYQHWKQGEKSSIPFAFLDVRSIEEYNQGHIAGAIHIPIQQLAQRLNELPKDKRLYVHCEAGVRSAKAAALLIDSGIRNIENMPAGMAGWRDAAYPIEK
ncbi:MAG: rhodanese-like domain-containing protein [Mariprofundaceae bacterium]|nr:rhodanese-like domain-containing protein [Mariprofundaceae bacterium]